MTKGIDMKEKSTRKTLAAAASATRIGGASDVENTLAAMDTKLDEIERQTKQLLEYQARLLA